MTEALSTNDRSRVTDPVVLEACKLALSGHAVSEHDIVAALLFGSRVKGFARPESDLDLIFLIRADAPGADFQYRRFHLGAKRIDSNVIKIPALNELCRVDADWAYRLQRACSIPELTPIPEQLVTNWVQKVDELLESPEACRFRLIRHVRDCRSLLNALQRSDSGAAAYLMVETIFLVPLIYLNAMRVVPYQAGQPWEEALTVASREDSAQAREYKTLVDTVSQSCFFQELSRKGLFAQQLKRVRDNCRQIIEELCGDVFRRGCGASLALLLGGHLEVQRRLAGLFPEEIRGVRELSDAIAKWLMSVNLMPFGLQAPRYAVPRRRIVHGEALAGTPRLIDYYPELERLKVIIPTGGCRVPSCTFCMLPLLAQPKADIAEILSRLQQSQQGRVRQLTVYTDGSFFDDRELSEKERLAITTSAKEFNAEELLVESLPRFLKRAAIENVLAILQPSCRLRIGVGVQSIDAQIRRYITSTPLSQRELISLLESRPSAGFCLRIFLMANKPLMSASEDRLDLYRSLTLLQRYLAKEDVVTVNPLLPTHGTFLEGLWTGGHWRSLTPEEAARLEADFAATDWGFHLEFGPSQTSTCTDIQLQPGADVSLDAGRGSQHPKNEISSRFLPWALLGGVRHRRLWANNLLSGAR